MCNAKYIFMVKRIGNAEHIKSWKKEKYGFAKLRLIFKDQKIRKIKMIGSSLTVA